MARIAVVGATSWGLTLSWLISRNGHDVTVVTRSESEAASLGDRRGIARLPEIQLPDTVHLSQKVPREVAGVIVAVPAQALRASVELAGISTHTPVLSAAKGIELTSGLSMSRLLAELGWGAGKVAVLSGPNLAHEIARGLPAAAVVAATDRDAASIWQGTLSTPVFRVYTSDDVVGVELGGAYKNVIAIAAGVGWGMQFGANTVAALMTRGLAEMTRLGVAMGANPATFQGLAGVGDLAATCFSPLSRNRRFGELLAAGEDVESARAVIGEAIEGIATAQVARKLADRLRVELPICDEVSAVVTGQTTVPEAMAGLLSRPLRSEAAWRS